MNPRKIFVFIVLFIIFFGFSSFVFAKEENCPSPRPILRREAVQRPDPCVRFLQQSLNTLIGSGLTVDGLFDFVTEDAVVDYQQMNNLGVDGIVGNETWNSIERQLQGPQGRPSDEFLGVQDFTVQRIARIITGFACWLIGIVLAVMVIFLVIAGVRYFLAKGNEVKVADATKNLTWTLVGIVVILATNVIIATVANALGSDYSFVPLNCNPQAQGAPLLTCLK